MNYFMLESLLSIHSAVLEVSGGMSGVKDRGLLLSPLESIRNDDYYPEFHDKLTHLVFSLIKNHGFNDGNKRSALASGALFLMINGYDDFVQYYIRTFEQVMVLVADNKLSKKQLSVLMRDIVNQGELSESSLLMIVSALLS